MGSVTKTDPDLPLRISEPGNVPADTKIILALGSEKTEIDGKQKDNPRSALSTIKALGVVPKGRAIGGLRKLLHRHPSLPCPVMVSYAPSIGLVDYGMLVELQCDMALAMRYARTGKIEPQLGDYRWVPDFSQLIATIKAQYAKTGKPVPVAYDTETLGLDPYNPDRYLICLQATCEVGKADAIYFASPAEEVAWGKQFGHQLSFLLNSHMVITVMANGKYDINWTFKRFGVDCTNFQFDTTIVGSINDENRSNALDVHTKIYAPMLGGYSDLFDATVDKSRMDLVPKDKMLTYAAPDADATLRVYHEQRKELLASPRLAKFYINLLHPAARAYERLERTGALVDKEAYRELESDLIATVSRTKLAARKIMGGRIFAKHYNPKDPENFNIAQPARLISFMFSPLGLNLKPKMFTAGSTDTDKTPSTAEEHMMMFEDVPEAKDFIAILKEHNSAAKMLSTYVVSRDKLGNPLKGFLTHLRADGYFHPSYMLHRAGEEEGEGGTVTGRLSARDPAFQCMVGETLVTTDQGEQCLDWLVEHNGAGLKVLTHTGKWRDIVGVYHNGCQPVFKVLLASNKSIVCTANHPVLTARGWVRTDELESGEHCYVRAQNPALHQPNVLLVDSNEKSLPQYDVQGLEELRRTRNNSLPALDEFPGVLIGHGGETSGWVVDRKEGCQRQLRTRQLPLGTAQGTGQQSAQYETGYLLGSNQDRSTVGVGSRYIARPVALPFECWYPDGQGSDETDPADRNTFEEDRIISVSFVGVRDTYDLTIDRSHSFVANGVVVHNTIPKHNKWAKAIRRCFIAPPGMLVVGGDYSQGELKLMACISQDPVMIQTYLDGKDLHVVTAADLNDVSYEQMMAWKAMPEDSKEYHDYEDIRQGGKAGNFGLIYGMQANGFVTYARRQYNVIIDINRATRFREGFFSLYKRLLPYHREYQDFAREFGFVRSPLGRVRHLPMINSKIWVVSSQAERQAINSPIQSTLSDMSLLSSAETYKRGWHLEAPQFGMVHDQNLFYMPEDKVYEYAQRQKNIMENLPFERFGWTPQLKFTVDFTMGPNLADQKKMKLN